MDASVGRSRRVGLLAVGALVAVGFIAAMAFTGGRRESQQRVQFQAAGLMVETPEQIDRVEIAREGSRLSFVRTDPGRWVTGGAARPVPPPLATHLEMSLRFMHTAEPVRTLARGEWESTRLDEFGLDPPRYAVALSRGGRTVLTARFGAPNPQQVLQYARVDGRDALHLMPRFVGREWELVLEAADAP